MLGDIADIRIGLVITRKKARTNSETKIQYKLITLKNIEADGSFNDEEFEVFNSIEILNDEYFTKEGDILLRMSEPHTAVYIDKSKEGLLIPSYFAIIKIKNSKFLPEYVAWYLNTSKTKKQIKRTQTGGTVVLISINNIGELNIEKIPIEKQNIIININNLKVKELNLLTQLIKEKQKYYRAISEGFIKRGGIKNE